MLESQQAGLDLALASTLTSIKRPSHDLGLDQDSIKAATLVYIACLMLMLLLSDVALLANH